MKRLIFFLVFSLISVSSFADVLLQKVNLPENWKLLKTSQYKNIKEGGLTIPVYVKQEIETTDSKVFVHYYFCKSKELADKLFASYFSQKLPVYRGAKTLIYRVEGEETALKNTLRFMELDLSQQIKLIFPEIAKIDKTTLASETFINQENLNKASQEFGAKIKSGLVQILTFSDSAVKLKIEYFHCLNNKEAAIAFKNARIKNTNDLVQFLAAQEFVARLTWIK